MVSLFLSNEELGKKDDDHKPTKIPPIRRQWIAAAPRLLQRKTLKRLALAGLAAFFVYLFIHNMPTDVPIRDRRHPIYPPKYMAPPSTISELKPHRKPPRPTKNTLHKQPHDSEVLAGMPSTCGPLKSIGDPLWYPQLGESLRGFARTQSFSTQNKNVLFAAASLKSASLLLPMACKMGGDMKNLVHFALMGGSDLDMKALRTVNGIDDSCRVIFHDARPDFPTESTHGRLEHSVIRALYFIHKFAEPQVVLVDSSDAEEHYLLRGIRSEYNALGMTLIELPENAHSKLSWVTKLDTSSLKVWSKLSIDILVHAPPGASGGLVRLLQSLSEADLSAGPIPHLTIELPQEVDKATNEYLNSFQWPPADVASSTGSHARQLTLRHRIPRARMNGEESSVRFLESFWPTDPRHSHVLVLSPQAQLGPRFLHYLRYMLLEYLYSSPATYSGWDDRLLGISLELPPTHLNASAPLTPPPPRAKPTAGHTNADDTNAQVTPFLWQGPNSNAALYLGQRWMELHALVSRTMDLHHTATKPVPAFFTEKSVSKRFPAWLEHALRLARARGYCTLYPSAAAVGGLATIHGEVYRAPEEYEGEQGKVKGKLKDNGELGTGRVPLIDGLPGGTELVALADMPVMSWDGNVTGRADLVEAAKSYAEEFRSAVGGCERLSALELTARPSLGDLFCLEKGDE